MSEQTAAPDGEETPAPETADGEGTDTAETEGEGTDASETDGEESEGEETEAASSQVRGLRSPLTRDSDVAARPGFRNPSNTRSKASRKRGKKGRRRK